MSGAGGKDERESESKSSGLKGLLLTNREHGWGLPSNQGHGGRRFNGTGIGGDIGPDEQTSGRRQRPQDATITAAAEVPAEPTGRAHSKSNQVAAHEASELDRRQHSKAKKETQDSPRSEGHKLAATNVDESNSPLAQINYVSASETKQEGASTSPAGERPPASGRNQIQQQLSSHEQREELPYASSNNTSERSSSNRRSPSKLADPRPRPISGALAQPRPLNLAGQSMLVNPSPSLLPRSSPLTETNGQLPAINDIMLIGLPLIGFLMLALIVCSMLKYCRRLQCTRRDRKQKGSSSSSKASKRNNLTNSPIGFISNGKLAGRDVLQGTDNFRAAGASSQSSSSPEARDARRALDCRQLTINMEGDFSSEDSEGQTQKQAKSKRSKQKPGRLKYALEYDFKSSTLWVFILEAHDLPSMDLNGSSDPYVKVYMASNKAQMFRTKIHKRTLNPVFNETFKFQVPYGELTQQTLILSVYDYDRLSRHDEIGQLAVAMSSIDLAQRQESWSELRKSTESTDGRLGDICLSLRYVPTAGKLNVVILEARQLRKMDLAGLSDPYVKLAIMSGGKRLKKKKTSIKKCTLNPHYNESFSFELPFEMAQRVQLVVTVVDYDRFGTSEPIGKITLGAEQTTGESEMRHWMDMLASARRPIAQWHSLKDIYYEETTSPLSQAGLSGASDGTHVDPHEA